MTAALAARDVWKRTSSSPRVFSKQERADAAVIEIARLEAAIADFEKAIRDARAAWPEVSNYRLNSTSYLRIEWARADLESTKADLEKILKE